MLEDFESIKNHRNRAKIEFAQKRNEVIEEHVGYLLHYKLYRTAAGFIFNQIKKFGLNFKLLRLLLYITKRKLINA